MEARKTEIAMGDCVKSDLESVGEEWKKDIDRRNWRLLKENVVRKSQRKKKDNGKGNNVNSPLTTVMPRKEKKENAI